MFRRLWYIIPITLIIALYFFYWFRNSSSFDAITSSSIRIIPADSFDIKRVKSYEQKPDNNSWINITNIVFKKEWTKYGGIRISIEYNLNEPDITAQTPAYIFIHYRKNDDKPWKLIPMKFLSGNGHNIVESPGEKVSYWWGTREMSFKEFKKVEFWVHGMKMVLIPSGEFIMKSVPGAGYDAARSQNQVNFLPTYYMAKYETTVEMYVDYLNMINGNKIGWNHQMADDSSCGIIKHGGFLINAYYDVVPGRENYPVTNVSWYDAQSFLTWCGLRLPTEAEFEKAFRGGYYLDDDSTKQFPNPMPDRIYPWGNQFPNEDDIYRCNAYGEEDGYPYTAPVGTYEEYNSPYGIADLAGNVAEWTLDWYTTSYHTGLDGYRMTRGGSYLEFSLVVDAITGATAAPLLENNIVGFRGVKDYVQ